MVSEEDRLRTQTIYVCPRCCDQARPIDNRPVTQVDVDGALLDVEQNFCYLGDILCAGRGCKLAIITRCGIAWGKFKRLLPILTSKHVSLRTREKVFNACVHSALLHHNLFITLLLGSKPIFVLAIQSVL